MKQENPVQLRMDADIYYIWVGGSTDYAHKERPGGGAYIMELNGKAIDTYVASDWHTTEFRMMLTVMLHAMETLQESSQLVFLTNVAYIQNFDKQPTEKSANADLIERCIALKERHKSVVVKFVPYHKFYQLPQTHEMAHQAMLALRSGKFKDEPTGKSGPSKLD